jgi:hypothetical protein
MTWSMLQNHGYNGLLPPKQGEDYMPLNIPV